MSSQILLWTALPNGVFQPPISTGTRTLLGGYRTSAKLSIHLSPRLEGNSARLDDLTDFWDTAHSQTWENMVKLIDFKVQVAFDQAGMDAADVPGGKAPKETVVSRPARPVVGLFARLFNAQTRIDTYEAQIPPVTRPVLSYRTQPIDAQITQQYRGVVTNPDLVFQPAFADKLRIAGNSLLGGLAISAPAPITMNSGGGGISTTVTRPGATLMPFQAAPIPEVERQQRFVEAPAVTRVPPVEPLFDFHGALSGMSNYPALMRGLGFVIDLSVPVSLLTHGRRVAGFIRVVPVWPNGDAETHGGAAHWDVSPWTRFVVDLDSTAPFVAAPRERTATVKPQISDGQMIVTPIVNTETPPAVMRTFDVDSALARLSSAALDLVVPAASVAGSKDVKIGPRTESISADSSAVDLLIQDVRTTLPTLRTQGPSLFVDGADSLFKVQMERTAVFESALAKLIADGSKPKLVLDAEDVNQGWRVDVWDHKSQRWHSLCERIGTYYTGQPGSQQPVVWDSQGRTTVRDEGWVDETVITDAGDPGNPTAPIRIHEQMFNWEGWSLVVPRPARPFVDGLGADGSSQIGTEVSDGHGGTYAVGHAINPDFPLDAQFSVPPNTLPLLRFGRTYRFRLRAVDLAGNSIPVSQTSPPVLSPTVTPPVTYRRWEPVVPPVVVPGTPLLWGESTRDIVVRSATGTTAKSATRHIAAPKTSQPMAEYHGKFDISAGPGLKTIDAGLHSLIVKKQGDFAPPGSSARPTETLDELPYLPDPLATGAAFRGLPGAPAALTDTQLLLGKNTGEARFVPIPVTSGAKVITQVQYVTPPSGEWWFKKPFVLRVVPIEGIDPRLPARATPAAPTWNSASRTLVVQVPKAERYQVDVSSVLVDTDLRLLEMRQLAASNNLTIDRVDRLTTSGRNWLLVPSSQITLTHAVDKPMLAPNLSGKGLSASRSKGDVFATVKATSAPIHGKSTGRVDLLASWTEYIDDPAQRTPRQDAVGPLHAFALEVKKDAELILNPNAQKPEELVAHRHQFGDTKYRRVTYQLKATSRFKDYFAPDPEVGADPMRFSVMGSSTTIDVLSSARPLAPTVAYCVPSFSWSPSAPSTVKSVPSRSRRGGIRIYLERPWYSSGQGERLGVVFWNAYQADGATPKDKTLFSPVEPWVTRWAKDPMWVAGDLPAPLEHLTRASFDSSCSPSFAEALTLAELEPELAPAGTTSPKNLSTTYTVSVASYGVNFDASLGLWYADIRFVTGAAYMPFLRLALCRYQPRTQNSRWSISPITVCDFVQQHPDRTLAITPTADKTVSRATLSGPSYSLGSAAKHFSGQSTGRVVRATVQRRGPSGTADVEGFTGPAAEADWETDPTVPERTFSATSVGYSAEVKLPTRLSGYQYRLAVREYERHAKLDADGSSHLVERLVYADTLWLWNGARL